jgi:cell division protein FtsA
MNRRNTPEYFVSLDVGTSKVAAMIAEIDAGGHLHVMGVGVQPSRGGMRRGVVVNIEATTDAIRRAVAAAETQANCRVRSAHVNITGSHIKSVNSVGVVPIRHREVTARDVDAVIEAASAVAIPADQQILHVIPHEYVVDGQEGIHDPVGMSAVRLESRVHIVSGTVSAVQNLHKCVERCGLSVEKLVLPHLASAEAVLSPDERELGVCLIDIGAGTSDVAVFKNGSIRHTAVLPIGGELVTNDIALAFRTSPPNAEEIKLRFGCALPESVDFDAPIDVPGVGESSPRRLSRLMLAEVMKPRYVELFRFIRKELYRADVYDLIAGGVVLTGGASLAPGLLELAEEIFEAPVRLGVPQRIEGLHEDAVNPMFAASTGLLIYARSQKPNTFRDHHNSLSSGGGGSGLFSGVGHFFSGFPNLFQLFLRIKSWVTGQL